MALIHCPECGKDISDQAPACVHCGYPMLRRDTDKAYSVVMLDAEPHPNQTRDTMIRHGMGDKRADKVLSDLPAVVWSGISLIDAYAKADSFQECGLVKVVLDENTHTKEDMRSATPVARAVSSPAFPFWPTVGAILTALLLWNVLLFFIAAPFQ